MNEKHFLQKCCRGESDDPLEIGFVSWPMVRYKREVLFGWVELLGKLYTTQLSIQYNVF